MLEVRRKITTDTEWAAWLAQCGQEPRTAHRLIGFAPQCPAPEDVDRYQSLSHALAALLAETGAGERAAGRARSREAPTVATNVWQGAGGKHTRELIVRFWPALAAIVPGVWAGSHLIGALAPGEAERGLGVALMLYAVLTLARRGGRYAPRRERTVTLIAGSANGLITGATGVLTIPMVPYMEALAIERDALVQLMAMVFCTSALSLALTLAETGRYDESLRNLSLWAVGPALAGVFAGKRLRARMSAERFRKWLLVALAGVGAKLALFG